MKLPAIVKTATAKLAAYTRSNMSEELVSNLSLWFALITVVLGVLAGASGAAAWIFEHVESEIKDEKLAKYQADAGREIAKANEGAEEARKGSAIANKYAEEARNDAAQAKTTGALIESNNLALKAELAKLEAAVQWRAITAEQEARLISLLKPFAAAHPMVNKTVNIDVHNALDLEADRYAKRIAAILKSCRFDVIMTPPHFGFAAPENLSDFPLGLDITAKGTQPPPAMESLVDAFRQAQVPIRLATLYGGGVADGIITIKVWHKPEKQ